jgi:N6-L-threonylcarbamoyladenine synthase
MKQQAIILGIETSCDETSVAIINDNREILSHLVFSQIDEHALYGGVVPEIAARSHSVHLQPLIQKAIIDSKINRKDLSAIAATTGPGLIGGVMIGMMAAKGLALGLQIPFLGINHLEAHILTARLTHNVQFPFLCLLVSGGHTQIIIAEDLGKYNIIASTKDDAVGECFDKSAKMMGLPFPGGPHLEKIAVRCDDIARAKQRFPFTIPMIRSSEIAFSFSGLKTAVRNYVTTLNHDDTINEIDLIDLCASFQDIIAETIFYRLSQALDQFKILYDLSNIPLVICGGVAANKTIRSKLSKLSETYNCELIAPPPNLCTDNGAMIAWAGMEYFKLQKESPLSLKALPRWPLDQLEQRWIITV